MTITKWHHYQTITEADSLSNNCKTKQNQNKRMHLLETWREMILSEHLSASRDQSQGARFWRVMLDESCPSWIHSETDLTVSGCGLWLWYLAGEDDDDGDELATATASSTRKRRAKVLTRSELVAILGKVIFGEEEEEFLTEMMRSLQQPESNWWQFGQLFEALSSIKRRFAWQANFDTANFGVSRRRHVIRRGLSLFLSTASADRYERRAEGEGDRGSLFLLLWQKLSHEIDGKREEKSWPRFVVAS